LNPIDNTPLFRRLALGHPRYWAHWLVVLLLRLLVLLPLRWQRTLGGGLGVLFGHLSRRRRRIVAVNLRLCFPDWSEERREKMLWAHFRSGGAGLLEAAFAWWASDRRLRGIYRIEGIEHLEAALARGRGVLLLSAHLTTLELVGRLLLQEHPMAVMYRPHENPVVERMFSRNRGRHALRAIRRDDIRSALRALRENLPIWYAPDQRMSGKNSVVVPFFGVPSGTSTATHRIARAAGAVVVPFFGFREASGQYRLVISPALDDFPGEDAAADTARVNRVIEEAIREAPEQYLWGHTRFRGRPGLPDPY
jgi:KDO2-lipid IV(A) lauroyltransferase